jgi:parallel beta-helix repeat protein
MNHRVVHHTLRVLIAAAALVGVSRPMSAAAQSLNIFPGDNIQQMVNSRAAGTTFVLKSGVHRLQNIVPRSGDRFLGEPGTVLSGARQLTSFGRSGPYWFVGGQTQEGPRPGGFCDPGFPRCVYPENFYIDSQPLRHVDSIGAVGPGTFFFDYAADRIYFVDDPTNRTVEASVTGKAFEGFATDVLISGLVIEKYATPVGEAAVGVGTRWTLQYSEIKLNHYAGVGTGTESHVHHNSIHHNGCFGLVGSGNYATVEYNELAYNNFARFNPYWGAGGTKFVYTVGLTLRGNSSHHNGGPGLWTDIGNIYSLYENNTVEDNERGGIFHELSYDATIRYNTARRNGLAKPYPYWTTGAGIEILDSRNVEVHGNVVEDNWQGITGLDDHRGNGPYGPYVLQNLYVHDNLITSRSTEPGSGRTGIIDMDTYTAYVLGNNRFVNNQYVLGNPNGHYFMWFGERTQYEWQNYGNDAGAAVGVAPTEGVRYLGDESFSQLMNGWGPAERNRSNGESGGSDGRQITLDGVAYARGIGVHSDSQLRWLLHGQCSTFQAVIGVDDEVGSNGSVIFQVYVDGALRFMSGVMRGSTPAQNVQVDVSGATELALFVHYGWDSYAYDHADWADARVTCR